MKHFDKNRGEGGFIKWVIIIVVALLILSYFGFSLRDTVESPTTQSNFSYLWNGIVYVWENFLARPIGYLWNEIFIDLIWKPLVLEGLKNLGGK